MATNVLARVFDASRAELGARLVIIALADEARREGAFCWPSKGQIMRMTRLSEATVERAIARLVQDGELEVLRHSELDSDVAAGLGKLGSTNVYLLRIALEPGEALAWSARLRGVKMSPQGGGQNEPRGGLILAGWGGSSCKDGGGQNDPLILDLKRSGRGSGGAEARARAAEKAKAEEPLRFAGLLAAVKGSVVNTVRHKGIERRVSAHSDGRGIVLTHVTSGHQLVIYRDAELADVEVVR